MGLFGLLTGHLERKRLEHEAQVKSEAEAAHKDWFPIVQKYAQGSPEVTDKAGQLALKQYSTWLGSLGPTGKNQAVMLNQAIEDMRSKAAPQTPPVPNGSVPGMQEANTTGGLNFNAPPAAPAALPPGGPMTPPDMTSASQGPPPAYAPPATLAPLPPTPQISAAGSPTSSGFSTANGFRAAQGDIGEAEAQRAAPTYAAQYKAQRDAEFAYKSQLAQTVLDQIKDPQTGEVNFTPQALVTLAAHGLSFPMAGAAMLNPVHMNGITTEDFARQFPEEFAATNIDAKANPVLNVTLSKTTGKPISIQAKGINMHFMPNGAGQIIAVNPVAPMSTPPVTTEGVASSQIAPKVVTGSTGAQGFITPAQAAQGASPTPIPGAVNSAFIPTNRTTSASHETISPSGAVETLRSGTATQTSKGAFGPANSPRAPGPLPPTPGESRPPAVPSQGQPVSPAAQAQPRYVDRMTPGQKITFNQKLSAFDKTLELANNISKNLNLVNSLIDAGKITLQVDPHQGIIKSIINRGMKLTKEESDFAGDVQSMMEHINTLRGPLGATGFRGPEAWGALQSQRGNLLANPQVTQRVLANTIKALQGQRDAIANGLVPGGGGLPPTPESGQQRIEQHSPSTGLYRHSLDGGKTWQSGRLP